MTEMTLLDEFVALDAAYDSAGKAWGDHVDDCPDCRRSVFACQEGQRLHAEWNAAWCKAKKVYLILKEQGIDPRSDPRPPGAVPVPRVRGGGGDGVVVG